MARASGYGAPKGTADLLPGDSESVEALETAFAALARRYAYRPVATPVFEHTEVFERSVGTATDIVGKEMYTFEDRAGRSLTLRPEGTAPIVRAFVEHGIAKREHLPWKVFYRGSMFRYERPQAGRMREFRQLGAEAIGSSDPIVDVEMIEMAVRFYGELGVDTVELMINSMGDGECRPPFVEEFRAYMRSATAERHELCADCTVRLETNPLRILDCKKPGCRELVDGAPQLVDALCAECGAHFAEVCAGLERLGIEFEVNARLVRGLDYYTRTTFELKCPALDAAQDALGGGGRYDGLVEVFGGDPTPAIGFALGVERSLTAIGLAGNEIGADLAAASVFVAPLVAESRTAATLVASRLRTAGVATEVGDTGRSAKAQMRLAGRIGAEVVVLIGPDELESGSVTVRSLREGGDQTEVPVDDAATEVVRTLGGDP